MARSKLQQMMEKDVEDMRQRAEDCRTQAEALTADALGLDGQIDNYETLISRAGDYEPESNDEELVHKATDDLWSFSKGDDGYVISRLFDETGDPLKA